MTLQTKLEAILPGVKDSVCHGIIERHLQAANPVAFKEVIVWGDKIQGFRCQAMTGREVFGHIFKIDVANETLLQVKVF